MTVPSTPQLTSAITAAAVSDEASTVDAASLRAEIEELQRGAQR